jgi:phosphodiesterase/alkaline phosphatase D-like protein
VAPTSTAAAAGPSRAPSQTPYPLTAALTAPFAYGVASGDMTADSALLWTRAPGGVDVIPELSESAGFERPTALAPVRASEASDFTVKVLARGLKPGTPYFYRFRAGADTSPVGSFRTAYAPDQAATVTMAFSGDANWAWKPYPLLNALVKEKLDYFLFLGDLQYETTTLDGTAAVEDLAGYRFKYRENREPRAGSPSKAAPMLDLYRSFGMYVVFDNHETGLSRADRSAPAYVTGGAQAGGQFVNQTPGFKARIQAFAEYQPVRDEQVSETGDPRSDRTGKFYRAVPWGKSAELILLDDRSYRDAVPPAADDPSATGCGRTMLGAPQLKWFRDELLAARARGVVWKLVVVSSPIQQLGTRSQLGARSEAAIDGPKSWAGAYACERNRLLKFVDDNAVDNVVFLTTDNHYTIVNNLRYYTVPDDRGSPTRPARNAFEILTGPIGADAGGIAANLDVDVKGLSQREADRKALAAMNGDAPRADGRPKGLKQAGLDPIGLEPDFPGLVRESVRAQGVPPGSIEPAAFASFNTFSYAVLTLGPSALTVQVKGFPSVNDAASLQRADVLREYEARQAEEILSFQVRAGGGD